VKFWQSKLPDTLKTLLEEERISVYCLFTRKILLMTSLANLFDISVVNTVEREQMWSLIIDAIDNLEKVARARELTNIIWDINLQSSKTDRDWQKTEILLESYEKTRDESLESALSNLKELVEIMSASNLTNRHSTK
jgi:hypothetical protein